MVTATTSHGTLVGSIRYPAAHSMRGAMRIQPATPIAAPMPAATAPVAAPLASIANRRCFSVAPTADIMPS